MIQIIYLLLIGLVAGAFSGILGIGGGIIVIPALVYIMKYSQQQAQGTSLGLLLPPVGILAVINYYKAGDVNIKAALIMSVAFIVGSYVSSKFALTLPESVLKKIFGTFLLFYAIKLFFEK